VDTGLVNRIMCLYAFAGTKLYYVVTAAQWHMGVKWCEQLPKIITRRCSSRSSNCVVPYGTWVAI